MNETSPLSDCGVYCSRCGYNLTGVMLGGRCPECGTPVAEAFQRSQQPAQSGKAVASMTLGIVSIASCFVFGGISLVCGVLAIIFWHLARQDLGDRADHGGAGGMARAGLVCGIIGIALALLQAGLFAVAILAGP